MNIKLNYIEKGTGEPLILLHGNGEDYSIFTAQIEYFSKEYRVIAVDTRGHGKSPRGTAPFTIRQFADDLYEFIRSLKIEKAHILGFSDGGNIALVFTVKHPEMVDKLILNGANLNTKGIKPAMQIPIEIGYYMVSFFGRFSSKARENAEMLRLMVKEPNIDSEEVKRVKNKTLVIAGKNDMVKQEHTYMIAGLLQNSQVVILPGDHFIVNKNPKEFNEKVESFLLS